MNNENRIATLLATLLLGVATLLPLPAATIEARWRIEHDNTVRRTLRLWLEDPDHRELPSAILRLVKLEGYLGAAGITDRLVLGQIDPAQPVAPQVFQLYLKRQRIDLDPAQIFTAVERRSQP